MYRRRGSADYAEDGAGSSSNANANNASKAPSQSQPPSSGININGNLKNHNKQTHNNNNKGTFRKSSSVEPSSVSSAMSTSSSKSHHLRKKSFTSFWSNLFGTKIPENRHSGISTQSSSFESVNTILSTNSFSFVSPKRYKGKSKGKRIPVATDDGPMKPRRKISTLTRIGMKMGLKSKYNLQSCESLHHLSYMDSLSACGSNTGTLNTLMRKKRKAPAPPPASPATLLAQEKQKQPVAESPIAPEQQPQPSTSSAVEPQPCCSKSVVSPVIKTPSKIPHDSDSESRNQNNSEDNENVPPPRIHLIEPFKITAHKRSSSEGHSENYSSSVVKSSAQYSTSTLTNTYRSKFHVRGKRKAPVPPNPFGDPDAPEETEEDSDRDRDRLVSPTSFKSQAAGTATAEVKSTVTAPISSSVSAVSVPKTKSTAVVNPGSGSASTTALPTSSATTSTSGSKNRDRDEGTGAPPVGLGKSKPGCLSSSGSSSSSSKAPSNSTPSATKNQENHINAEVTVVIRSENIITNDNHDAQTEPTTTTTSQTQPSIGIGLGMAMASPITTLSPEQDEEIAQNILNDKQEQRSAQQQRRQIQIQQLQTNLEIENRPGPSRQLTNRVNDQPPSSPLPLTPTPTDEDRKSAQRELNVLIAVSSQPRTLDDIDEQTRLQVAQLKRESDKSPLMFLRPKTKKTTSTSGNNCGSPTSSASSPSTSKNQSQFNFNFNLNGGSNGNGNGSGSSGSPHNSHNSNSGGGRLSSSFTTPPASPNSPFLEEPLSPSSTSSSNSNSQSQYPPATSSPTSTGGSSSGKITPRPWYKRSSSSSSKKTKQLIKPLATMTKFSDIDREASRIVEENRRRSAEKAYNETARELITMFNDFNKTQITGTGNPETDDADNTANETNEHATDLHTSQQNSTQPQQPTTSLFTTEPSNSQSPRNSSSNANPSTSTPTSTSISSRYQSNDLPKTIALSPSSTSSSSPTAKVTGTSSLASSSTSNNNNTRPDNAGLQSTNSKVGANTNSSSTTSQENKLTGTSASSSTPTTRAEETSKKLAIVQPQSNSRPTGTGTGTGAGAPLVAKTNSGKSEITTTAATGSTTSSVSVGSSVSPAPTTEKISPALLTTSSSAGTGPTATATTTTSVTSSFLSKKQDWICSRCTLKNVHWRSSCEACYFKADSSVQKLSSAFENNSIHTSSSSAIPSTFVPASGKLNLNSTGAPRTQLISSVGGSGSDSTNVTTIAVATSSSSTSSSPGPGTLTNKVLPTQKVEGNSSANAPSKATTTPIMPDSANQGKDSQNLNNKKRPDIPPCENFLSQLPAKETLAREEKLVGMKLDQESSEELDIIRLRQARLAFFNKTAQINNTAGAGTGIGAELNKINENSNISAELTSKPKPTPVPTTTTTNISPQSSPLDHSDSNTSHSKPVAKTRMRKAGPSITANVDLSPYPYLQSQSSSIPRSNTTEKSNNLAIETDKHSSRDKHNSDRHRKQQYLGERKELNVFSDDEDDSIDALLQIPNFKSLNNININSNNNPDTTIAIKSKSKDNSVNNNTVTNITCSNSSNSDAPNFNGPRNWNPLHSHRFRPMLESILESSNDVYLRLDQQHCQPLPIPIYENWEVGPVCRQNQNQSSSPYTGGSNNFVVSPLDDYPRHQYGYYFHQYGQDQPFDPDRNNPTSSHPMDLNYNLSLSGRKTWTNTFMQSNEFPHNSPTDNNNYCYYANSHSDSSSNSEYESGNLSGSQSQSPGNSSSSPLSAASTTTVSTTEPIEMDGKNRAPSRRHGSSHHHHSHYYYNRPGGLPSSSGRVDLNALSLNDSDAQGRQLTLDDYRKLGAIPKNFEAYYSNGHGHVGAGEDYINIIGGGSGEGSSGSGGGSGQGRDRDERDGPSQRRHSSYNHSGRDEFKTLEDGDRSNVSDYSNFGDNTNTLAVNKLLRKLECAIAKGDHRLAATLAHDLALLKVNCVVAKGGHTPQPQPITIRVYVEDRFMQQGPFQVQVTSQMTVKELKNKIETDWNIPSTFQKWILGRKIAEEDTQPLSDFDVVHDSMAFLYLVTPQIERPQDQPIPSEKSTVITNGNNTSSSSSSLSPMLTSSSKTKTKQKQPLSPPSSRSHSHSHKPKATEPTSASFASRSDRESGSEPVAHNNNNNITRSDKIMVMTMNVGNELNDSKLSNNVSSSSSSSGSKAGPQLKPKKVAGATVNQNQIIIASPSPSPKNSVDSKNINAVSVPVVSPGPVPTPTPKAQPIAIAVPVSQQNSTLIITKDELKKENIPNSSNVRPAPAEKINVPSLPLKNPSPQQQIQAQSSSSEQLRGKLINNGITNPATPIQVPSSQKLINKQSPKIPDVLIAATPSPSGSVASEKPHTPKLLLSQAGISAQTSSTATPTSTSSVAESHLTKVKTSTATITTDSLKKSPAGVSHKIQTKPSPAPAPATTTSTTNGLPSTDAKAEISIQPTKMADSNKIMSSHPTEANNSHSNNTNTNNLSELKKVGVKVLEKDQAVAHKPKPQTLPPTPAFKTGPRANETITTGNKFNNTNSTALHESTSVPVVKNSLDSKAQQAPTTVLNGKIDRTVKPTGTVVAGATSETPTETTKPVSTLVGSSSSFKPLAVNTESSTNKSEPNWNPEPVPQRRTKNIKKTLEASLPSPPAPSSPSSASSNVELNPPTSGVSKVVTDSSEKIINTAPASPAPPPTPAPATHSKQDPKMEPQGIPIPPPKSSKTPSPPGEVSEPVYQNNYPLLKPSSGARATTPAVAPEDIPPPIPEKKPLIKKDISRPSTPNNNINNPKFNPVEKSVTAPSKSPSPVSQVNLLLQLQQGEINNISKQELEPQIKPSEMTKELPVPAVVAPVVENKKSDALLNEKENATKNNSTAAAVVPEQAAGTSSASQKEDNVQTYLKMLHLMEQSDLISNAEEFECLVCFSTVNANDGVVLRDCLHSFCRECLIGSVQYADEPEVKCPFRDDKYSCNSVVQEREIKALVPSELFEKHLARSVKIAECKIVNTFHCKTADCTGWCVFEDDVNVFNCPVCKKRNCLTCQAIHEGVDCQQYQRQLSIDSETDENAKSSRLMLEKMIQRGEALECPACHVVLLKKWGCDWVRCSYCKTEICWVTKGFRWGPNGKGDLSGGCKCGVNGVRCHPKCTYCH